MNKIHDHIDMMDDGRNFFVGAKNGLVITIAAVALIAVLMLCCGCEGDSSSSTTNNYPPDIVETNEPVSSIVIAQDGAGNYVQVNVQTGEIVPIQIGQLGTNNVVIVDVTAPPPPPLPTPPTPEL